uniref:Uncharacterized protein n=1 Tax=Piliocolobus tephrosceles TaxID=591936 RepID=A0A8C9HSB6_9PRIM
NPSTWGAAITDVPVTLQLFQRRPLFAETILGGRGRSPGGSWRQELLEGARGRARVAAAANPIHRGGGAATQTALYLPQPSEGLQKTRRLHAPGTAGSRHRCGLRAGRPGPRSHPRQPDQRLRREGAAAASPTPGTSNSHDTGSRKHLSPARSWENATAPCICMPYC